MVNTRGEVLELRLRDVIIHVREITLQGIRHGTTASLSTAQARSGYDLCTVEPGFPKNEDLEAHGGAMEDFATHAEAIADATLPQKIIEKVFNN